LTKSALEGGGDQACARALDGAVRYVDDGRIEIDDNVAERAIGKAHEGRSSSTRSTAPTIRL
jgi:hypothetical protein